ncbi:Gmad2 immunoglobulin-like domain-containing protein [Micromonospora sp. WMMD812]|uniref:Gmad2 immunoglobulin-like domain-containing protein n=1 Tax=Micromonospora sp. WMMD812 TaxID=3015152 RepID=UPI00248BC899|nr:Gmad2 immunoglobulin-like domain-containing protein [Micromonospora sp. WMMD812]WBB69464.1 GerMN domain-containing protein [Micromonospora sp. WMMD812]
MRRLLAGILLAAALLPAGCAHPRSGSLGPAPTAAPPPASPAPSPSPTGSAGITPTPSGPRPTPADTPPPTTSSATVGTINLELWFVRDGRLTPTRRTRPSTVATSRLALTELIAGPTRAEAAAGLTTLVPTGAEPVGVADGVVTVRLATVAGDPAARRLRQAQVVWTLTQFPTVRRVRFDPPAEGADGPVGRADYADLLPPIVVTSPAIGQRISSPLTVTGTADVFEATVSIRLLDAGGREIATTFTTASCGSGCRGDYRTPLTWRVAGEQRGRLEVYEVSARNGSRINVVTVPVTLVPAR